MKIMNLLIILLLIIIAGCKPSDFSTLSAPGNSFSGRTNFQHEKVPGVSCMQCHEATRPVYTAPLAPHGNGADCNTCHTSAVNAQGARTWYNLIYFSHNPTPTACLHCHDATTKPKSAPHLAGQWADGQDCVSCHTFPKWNIAKFDHNKPLTTCIDCHQIAKDSRPTGNIKTLHPSIFYENLGIYYTAIVTGDTTRLTATGKNISYTSPLTPPQATILNRLLNVSLITQADTMQMDCILCHANNTNTQDPNNSLVANPNSKKWTSAAFSGANSSVTFNYADHTPAPSSCVGCHEIQRPSNHTITNTMNAGVPGMDKGDCQGCHTLPITRAPLISDWRDLLVAFDHDLRKPTACIGCHQNSIPANQRPLTVTATPTHPVSTGTYYKIDCVQCHTYDSTRQPPSAIVPSRSWANIYFSYKTHLYDNGTTTWLPTACIVCHKNGNDSRPNPAFSTTHTKGSRLNNDCATCHVFDSLNKWQHLKTPGFDHSLLDPTPNADRCDSCHKASVPLLTSLAKITANVVHLPVSGTADCSSCHTGSLVPSWKRPNITYTHAATDACSSCHRLANPSKLVMPDVVQFNSAHFPIGSMECSTCHTATNTTNYTTFRNSVFSHTNTGGNKCATCHADPNYAATVTKQLPLPLGTAHLTYQTGNDCNVCHISTTSFTGLLIPSLNVTYTHNLALDTDCNSCHKAVSGHGFATGTDAATNTHMTIPYKVVNGTLTTDKVQCSTCHQDVNSLGLGTVIKTAPDFKIHTSANTKLTTTSPIDSRCNVCHDGAAATAKTINDFNGPHGTLTAHPSLGTLQCVACHSASLSTSPKYKDFTGGLFVHTTTLTSNNTSCNSCHGGATPIATSTSAYAGHVPSTKECVFCHTASITTFSSFTNGNYNHSDGVNCKTCHADSTLTVIPNVGPTQRTAANVGGAQNATLTVIHNGAGTAAACDTCHKDTAGFTTWKIHTSAATTLVAAPNTKCNTCHTGLANSYGLLASTYTNHVPVGTAECIACHANVTSKTPVYKDFTGGVYNHTGTETCSTCHTATTTVIHTTNAATNCNTCHTDTVNYTTWKIHTSAATTGYTACNTCHLVTAVPLVLKNRSSSASYNHFTISKANATAAECATCHQASMTATTTWPSFTATTFAGGLVHTNSAASAVVITANCTSCHTSTYSSSATVMRTLPSTTSNPALHLTLPVTTVAPIQATQCDTCHQDASFTVWKGMVLNSPATSKVKYAHNINATSDLLCSTCHTAAAGFAEGMSTYKNAAGTASIHMSTTAQCSTCHQGADAGGALTIKYTDFIVHSDTSTQTETRCNICHDNSVAPGGTAIGKTISAFVPLPGFTSHPAYNAATKQCVECHQSSLGSIPPYISFAGGNAHDASASSTNNWSECNKCHLSDAGVIQNINNNPTYKHFSTQSANGTYTVAATGLKYVECAVCHAGSINSVTPSLGFRNFTGGKLHSLATTSGIGVTACASCHNSNFTYGTTSFRKLPTSHLTLRAPIGATTDAECSTCHAVTNNNSAATNLWTGMAIANSLNGAVALNVTYTHATGDKGNCVTCHTGATGFAEGTSTTPGGTHLILPKIANVNVNCDTCHSISVAPAAIRAQWRGMAVSATTATVNSPVDVTYNHQTIGTATCKSCHFDATGGASVPRGMAVGTDVAIHSPYINTPDRVAHISTFGSDCKGCHLDSIAGGKSTVAPVAAKTFAAYESFFGGTPQDHSSTSTNCLACHWSGNGSTGTILNAIKTTNVASYKHIDITSGSTVIQCSVCHQASMVGGNATTPFTFPANTGFGGGLFHANATASGLSATTCNTCHNGAFTYESTAGVFKKLPTEGTNHLTRTATGTECSVCHTVTNNSSTAVNSWKGMLSASANPVLVAYTHNLTYDSTCKNCHQTNTSAATYVNKSGFATGYTNSTVHTTNTTVECSTCHQAVSGTTLTAKLTPNFKIHDSTNTTNNTKCNICHLSTATVSGNASQTGTTVTGTGFTAGIVGSQFTFANGVTSGAITAFNSATSLTVTTAQSVAAQTYTVTGITKYRNYTNTGYVHFPINNGTAMAECYTCHAASVTPVSPTLPFANFTGGLFHANSATSGVPTTICMTCHKGSGTGYVGANAAAITALSTPATHLTLPVATTTYAADCKTCHVTTTFNSTGWKGTIYNSTGTAKVTYSHNINATSDLLCSTCHDVTKTVGYATGKTAGVTVHGVAAGAQQCSVCHLLVTGTGAASATTTKITTDFKIHDTTNLTTSYNRCNVCHLTTATSSATVASINFYNASGTYNHLPIKTTATAATYAECSICHQYSLTAGGTMPTTAPFIASYSFMSGKFHSTVTASSAINTTCATCHNSASYTYEKVAGVFKKLPAAHLSLLAPLGATATAECSVCHAVTNDSSTVTNKWTGMAIANAASPTTVALNVTYKHGAADIAATAACSSCHKGTAGYAEGTSSVAAHLTVPLAVGSTTTNAECIACHIVSTLGIDSWKTWRAPVPQVVYNAHNTTATTACTTCHTNAAGFAKGTAADTTVGGHPSTVGLGECTTCHSASSATGGASTYISFNSPLPKDHRAPVNGVGGSNCNTCHLTATGAITNFSLSNKTISTYTHFPITNNVGASVSCAVCHTASLTTFNDFTGGLLHTKATTANVTITARCATCHTGTYTFGTATFTPVGTASQSGSTITGTGTSFSSAMVGSQFTFANGVKAGLITAFTSATSLTVNTSQTVAAQAYTMSPNFRTLTATHFTPPTSTNCDKCHNIATAAGLTWNGMPLKGTTTTVTYDHLTTGTATCKSCHGGTSTSSGLAEGPGNVPTGFTHLTIPTVADCNTCHTSKTVWTGIKTNPTNVAYTHTTADKASCSICHTGSLDSTPVQHGGAIGINYFATLNAGTPHMTINGTDCAGCHSASITNNYTSFAGGLAADHRAGANCINCHWNSTTNQLANISHNPTYSHFPIYTTGTTPAQCSACHAASQTTARNYDNWSGGLLHANATAAAVSITNCNGCHYDTTTNPPTIKFAPHWTPWVVPALPIAKTVASGLTNLNLHITIGSTQCGACHTNATYSTFANGFYNHTNTAIKFTATAYHAYQTSCSNCHTRVGTTVNNALNVYYTYTVPVTGYTPASYMCMGCHWSSFRTSAHRASTTAGKWSRCLDCHSGDGNCSSSGTTLAPQ